MSIVDIMSDTEQGLSLLPKRDRFTNQRSSVAENAFLFTNICLK